MFMAVSKMYNPHVRDEETEIQQSLLTNPIITLLANGRVKIKTQDLSNSRIVTLHKTVVSLVNSGYICLIYFVTIVVSYVFGKE